MKKNQNPGGRLGATSKTALPIFSIATGADFSFDLIFIETYAHPIIGYNNLFLGSVKRHTYSDLPSNRAANLIFFGIFSKVFFTYVYEKCPTKTHLSPNK